MEVNDKSNTTPLKHHIHKELKAMHATRVYDLNQHYNSIAEMDLEELKEKFYKK